MKRDVPFISLAEQIKAAARKALITADPLYYSWPPDQQERFRANMDKTAGSRVDAVLLNELLGITCTAENASSVWRDLPLSKLNNLNWAKLLTAGIGEDMIFLNESMAEDTSLLDFNTLYDYDFADHLFQEEANQREFKDYQSRDYYALRFSLWARLIIKERFYYASLHSLAGYLTAQLEDQERDIIQALIPHEYVNGKAHGKPEQGGFLWDLQLDAAGQEKQLEELQSRWHHYSQQRWTELSQSFTHHLPAVFMNDTFQDGEPHLDFIFNNEAALKCIRWRHFLSDCEQIKNDFAEVTRQKEQELEKANNWLRETHQDIMLNFDTTVTKLRKRRKIVVAPEAFDDLLASSDDDPE